MLDQEMREPLFDYLDENFGKIRVIEEKTIRGSRADVLGVLDGYFVGFEIKSDQDTYERLKTQVKDYDRYAMASFPKENKELWRAEHWEQDLQQAVVHLQPESD